MKYCLAVVVLLHLTACAEDVPAAPSAKPAETAGPVLLVVGDSLSAAYGLDPDVGWVALLRDRLGADFPEFRVVNASVSGDTTAGGLSRLRTALPRHQPAVVVIELGGNDGLRGIPLPVVETNLEQMVEMSLSAGAEVALLGIRIPTNYGPRYAEQFAAIYARLARRHGLPDPVFFLEGVALEPSLMQSDGIHPAAAAQPRLLDNAWPAIEQVLKRIER